MLLERTQVPFPELRHWHNHLVLQLLLDLMSLAFKDTCTHVHLSLIIKNEMKVFESYEYPFSFILRGLDTGGH